MNTQQWHVVYIRPQWERIVHDQIISWYGMDAWCPFKTVKRQWSDRLKAITVPVFKGYVFVKAGSYQERLQVLQLDGVVNFIQYEKKPAVVREAEMATLRQFIEQHPWTHVTPLAPGRVIQLTRGVLSGQEGIIKSVSENKVILELPRLGFLLTASREALTDLTA